MQMDINNYARCAKLHGIMTWIDTMVPDMNANALSVQYVEAALLILFFGIDQMYIRWKRSYHCVYILYMNTLK